MNKKKTNTIASTDTDNYQLEAQKDGPVVLGRNLDHADDNSLVVLVEEELAGSYTVPVDAQIERMVADSDQERQNKKFDAPWKLTHADWSKQEEEEPYKKAVEQPDMVLEGVVRDDDEGNHLDEDEEETV